jgi:ABC-type spermidine/putrescine transport system permease subunit I
VLLQDNGPINNALIGLGLIAQPLTLLHNRFAVVLGMVHYALPYAVFPIYSAMLAIDDRLDRAARSLGAPTAAVIWLIVLPLTRPGVYAASLLVFIISASFYITPLVLGSPKEMMIANLVDFYTHQIVDFGTASALSVIILVAAGVLIAVYQTMPKEGQHGAV